MNRLRELDLFGASDCLHGSPTSCRDRINRLFSGVRSSCDMFAKNSDLYLEVSASCSAFSSIASRASSTSRFLASTSAFWRASSSAFSSNCFVCPPQLFLLLFSSSSDFAQRFRLLFQSLVGCLQFVLLALQLGRQAIAIA